jgi:hypothetical protein
MITFENGDVMLNKDEYENLIAKKGDRTVYDLSKAYRKLSDFYYNLIDAQKYSSIIGFNPNKAPETEARYYHISEGEFKTYQQWRKIISKYSQD